MALSLALLLGFFLGIRHATDADHLVAISTMVRREPGILGALRTGALWGLGHTVTVVAVGIAMVIFGVTVSDRAATAMELAVAAMLVVLGTLTMREALVGKHEPLHGHAHRHAHAASGYRLRPVLVGIVHGLAGSAGVTLMALTTIKDPHLALAYLALFGLGTVVGMVLVTTILAFPLKYAAARFAHAEQRILLGAGVVSIAFGVVLAVRLTAS